eukprot:scaffold33326_cov72-Cyclotella_meneghiniana.AAC.3
MNSRVFAILGNFNWHWNSCGLSAYRDLTYVLPITGTPSCSLISALRSITEWQYCLYKLLY